MGPSCVTHCVHVVFSFYLSPSCSRQPPSCHSHSGYSLSKDQLVDEVTTLTRERDLLARQLEDVVSNFDNQIRELEHTSEYNTI